MKTRSAILLLAGLTGLEFLLAGCSTLSPEQGAVLQAASARYARARLNMTREELVATFGAPRNDRTHLLEWDVGYGANNFESLAVELDAGNRAAAIARTHCRFTWGPAPGGFESNGTPYAPGDEPHRHTSVLIRPGYRPTEIQELSGG